MRTKEIVFVSGWAHSAVVFDGLKQELGDEFELKAYTLPELRAHFEDQMGAPTTSEQSPYARALRDLVGGRKPVVVGYSMGGMAALEALVCSSDAFDKLVLVSSAARFSRSPDYALGVPQESLSAMRARFQKAPEEVLANFFQQVYHPQRLNYVAQQEKVGAAMKQGADELMKELCFLETFDVRHKIDAISAPVLIVHGKDDAVIKWQAAELLKLGITKAKLVVLHAAGHALLEQNAGDLAREIRESLR